MIKKSVSYRLKLDILIRKNKQLKAAFETIRSKFISVVEENKKLKEALEKKTHIG